MEGSKCLYEEPRGARSGHKHTCVLPLIATCSTIHHNLCLLHLTLPRVAERIVRPRILRVPLPLYVLFCLFEIAKVESVNV